MAVLEVNDNNFQEVLDKNKVVVVKYFADWCGSCKLFSPKFRRVSEEPEMSDIAFVDVNAEENPNTRQLAGVDNLPFLAVFVDGKLVEGSASSKEEYLRSLIAKAQA